jgi:hypothetical protein
MKQILLVLLLSVIAVSAFGQAVVPNGQVNTFRRLSTGFTYSSLVALPAGGRDTTRGMWIYNTHGVFAATCSIAFNSGAHLSIGYLKSSDGTNYAYGDSTAILNSTTNGGVRWLSLEMPPMANIRFTISNPGSDTAFFRFLGSCYWLP